MLQANAPCNFRKDTLLSFVNWLASTPGSIALHESLYAYPIVEVCHVLGLILFAGTIVMIDIRIIGAGLRSIALSEMIRRILPWTLIGFVIMVITGALLCYAIPVRTFHSVWFRLKLILMFAAALNAWMLHRRIAREPGRWDQPAGIPHRARLAALLSIALWSGVIIAGRLMAYDWLDCERPQARWLKLLAQCPES